MCGGSFKINPVELRQKPFVTCSFLFVPPTLDDFQINLAVEPVEFTPNCTFKLVMSHVNIFGLLPARLRLLLILLLGTMISIAYLLAQGMPHRAAYAGISLSSRRRVGR